MVSQPVLEPGHDLHLAGARGAEVGAGGRGRRDHAGRARDATEGERRQSRRETPASQSDVGPIPCHGKAALTGSEQLGDRQFRTCHPRPGRRGGRRSYFAVGAYNEATDRFLVLDVARYKYKPSWVTAAMLFDAMNTTDSSSGGPVATCW